MQFVEKKKAIGKEKYDILIVGAGLSGAIIAERFASHSNKKVLIIDKREHIGGNCFDYIDENGILINKYGAHLFHTNSDEVWKYIQKFSDWLRWDHRVLSRIEGKLVNIPVNINTVNSLCGTNIKDEKEMNQWLETVQIKFEKVSNSEEIAKSRVGEVLYKKLFRDYTYKQWNKYPEELDSSVLSRIPVRNNFDDRYFDDRYQVLPKYGYSKFVENILSHANITVQTNIDFFEIKNSINYTTLIYTGPIDQYFESSGLAKLEYRSIEFMIERYKSMHFFQPNSVINYPENNVPFTRIVEYKHFLHQQSPHTTIVKEITKVSGEPYYPIPNYQNLSLYEVYKELSKLEKDAYFIGRLANYQYYNMDQAIMKALEFYNNFDKEDN
jgi:UDP-galactopyranose mutase